MKHLGTAAQGLPEGGGGDRHNHELLDLHIVGGVGAAVEDVHHRHGQLLGVDAADIAVQAGAQALGRRLGAGQGRAQDGVGTQAGLVGGAVQVDQGLVDGGLIQDIHADQALGDLGVDVLHSLFHALAVVAALVAVPQLAGLIDAGGSAGGHGGAAHSAVLQIDLHFHSGVAPAV